METYSTETLEDMSAECDLRIQDYSLTPEKRQRSMDLKDRIEAELEKRRSR